MLHFYPLKDLISNLMPATLALGTGTGATMGWKSKTFWRELGEQLIKLIDIRSVTWLAIKEMS